MQNKCFYSQYLMYILVNIHYFTMVRFWMQSFYLLTYSTDTVLYERIFFHNWKCSYKAELSCLSTALQFRGETGITAAKGDGVRSSWSWALHRVLCHRADDCQTATGNRQYLRNKDFHPFLGDFSVVINVSPLTSSTGCRISRKPIRVLPVRGEGPSVEGAQRSEALCSVSFSGARRGGGQSGVQLEHWGWMCGEDRPENQRGGTQTP